MSWPNEIYVATENRGVYYTDDFSDPAIQPHWATINTGLGALDCLEFHLDPFDNAYRQFVLIESLNKLYRRENGGSWEEILTLADVQALLGGTAQLIGGFWPDPSIQGRIWATVYTDNGTWHKQYYAIYSNDYGDTWNATTPFFDSFASYNIWTVRAYGDTVFASAQDNTGAYLRVHYSSNKGANWGSVALGNTYVPHIHLNPLLPTKVYCVTDDANHLTTVTNAGVHIHLQPRILERLHSMWFDPDDSQHQRIVDDYKLFVTIDDWANESDSGAVTPHILGIAPWAGIDDDQMLVELEAAHLAGNEHVVGALYGEADTSAQGIAGSSPGSAPYTDSIPYYATPCECGIQAVGFAVGRVYTHAIAMPDYDGEDRGIPMQGDRSARDALHYPERHTNDINNPTGIHWTKSEIESLIPDVVSENEFDYGIFLASCFRNATLDLWLLWSDNGKAFSQIGSGALYSPGCVRDPSIVSYHGRYYVAHTNVSFGVSTTFSVAVSDDLISWSHVIDVDMTSIVGVAHVWAPEWFIDDDGSLYIFVSCNTNAGDPVGGFKLYEVHPTSEDFLSWSVPAEVTGTGLRSSMVDPFVVKFNGKYHIWYKYSGDEHVEYMSSDNLISDYTITESGDWAGWGSGLEGPSLVRIDYKTWRIYFDKYTEQGIYYSESVDDWANWTAKALITAPFTPAHPTVIQSRDLDLFRDLLNAIGVTPSSHHTTHENGGDDAIKLDDLSAPDNNTDLNASITKHGLMQKYPGGTEDFLRSDGNWAAPAVSGGEILIEDGSSAPPIMLTNEDETDFLYEG